ncbi:hypothetical protein [Shewanella morhuae]|uniref:Uncharacterized protein n=1 Tax=Shewanella morhuae TaxID=365591 RepID=A0A379ZWI2_9GAMM|nr:hypothetical protein [Shewanella morhuae]SUI69465.1 Uncharacterised protein [Shewanella morhuae]
MNKSEDLGKRQNSGLELATKIDHANHFSDLVKLLAMRFWALFSRNSKSSKTITSIDLLLMLKKLSLFDKNNIVIRLAYSSIVVQNNIVITWVIAEFNVRGC